MKFQAHRTVTGRGAMHSSGETDPISLSKRIRITMAVILLLRGHDILTKH